MHIHFAYIYISTFLKRCTYKRGWLRSTVGGTPVFGRPTDPVLLSGDHYVGKPYTTGQPTRPTQLFILPGSINE